MPATDARLLSALAGFGYAPPGEAAGDPQVLLARISASHDNNLLAGFPVILANAMRRADSGVDLAKAAGLLRPGPNRARFRELVAISFSLFESHGLGALRQSADPEHQFGDSRGLNESIVRGHPITLTGGGTLEPAALERAFLANVVPAEEARRRAALEKKRQATELSQEYQLSLLLSPRQKDLLFKRLRGELLSKTEREYFSRVVRKKLAAIIDPELQKLAQKALA